MIIKIKKFKHLPLKFEIKFEKIIITTFKMRCKNTSCEAPTFAN